MDIVNIFTVGYCCKQHIVVLLQTTPLDIVANNTDAIHQGPSKCKKKPSFEVDLKIFGPRNVEWFSIQPGKTTTIKRVYFTANLRDQIFPGIANPLRAFGLG